MTTNTNAGKSVKRNNYKTRVLQMSDTDLLRAIERTKSYMLNQELNDTQGSVVPYLTKLIYMEQQASKRGLNT